MRHPGLLACLAVTAFGLTAFSAPQSACGCVAPRPTTLARAAPVALDVICTAYPADRNPASVREEAMEHGFDYWGEFSEIETRDGGLEVRPGARPGDACALEALTDAAGARRLETALSRWARSRSMRRQAARHWTGGEDVGALDWSVSPAAGDRPAVVAVTYRPPSGD